MSANCDSYVVFTPRHSGFQQNWRPQYNWNVYVRQRDIFFLFLWVFYWFWNCSDSLVFLFTILLYFWAVMAVIVWYLDQQLSVQSVPITTNVVSSNSVHYDVYSIHYVIKLISDWRQVGGFLWVLFLHQWNWQPR